MQIYDEKIFENPTETICAFNETEFKSAFDRIQHLSKTSYLLGYIRYEAKDVFLNKKIKSNLPLLYFEAFKDFKHHTPKVSEDIYLYTNPCISFDDYKKAIEKIKDEISNGNTYEVNYTYDFDVFTDADEKALYEYLLKHQKTPYNALISNKYETVLSFSPELFFSLEKNKILTKPMKGTIKRGKTEDEDNNLIEFLKNDIKNRAENVMIVDLLRNDLSKIAKTGSVKVPKLFEIETHKTLHQMTSEITAEIESNTTLYDIFQAIFPCGSITGAPKRSTMEIIEKTEKGKRGIYCGAIGFLSPQKSVFSVPIRILQKSDTQKAYKYRVGGAIVWDSSVEEEWEETITKMSFLNIGQNSFQLIETLKAKDKEFLYADEHFKRLEESAKIFGFKFPKELKQIKPAKDGIVRILLSKNGHFDLQYRDLKESKSDRVCIAKENTNSKNAFLYHKTTHRPLYEKSFEKIKAGEIYDEIFFNEKGELTEGARTNIVLQIDGKLFTPPQKCGLLNGILRQELLSQNHEKKITEKILYKTDLKKAQKIFCINSVRGIQEVVLEESDKLAVSK